MKKEIIVYLAGIIDGEGSIRIELEKGKKRQRPDYYRLRLSVSNTYYGLMEWLTEHFIGSFIKEKKRVGNLKQVYQWEIKAPKRVAQIVRLIYPYLIVKKRQAEIAFELAEIMGKTRHKYSSEERQRIRLLYEQMRIANQRGRASIKNE